MSACTVFEVPKASGKLTSSCGNGTRLVQFVSSDQLPPSALVHACGAAAVTILAQFVPELPPQSPIEVADISVGVPAKAISLKSAFEIDTVPFVVIVLDAPKAIDVTKILFITLLPFITSAPLTVKVVVLHELVLAAVPVTVKLLRVVDPANPPFPPVKDTL
jgi:hypothetical protein